MPKIVLNDISNITGNPTSAEQLLNDNFTKLEIALENTLSRDGTTPNALEATLDVNSQRIINVPWAIQNTEPVPLGQLTNALANWGGGTGGGGGSGGGNYTNVYYQNEPPVAPEYGTVWVMLDGTIHIWNGTQWIRNTDPWIADAVAQSNAAVARADDALAAAQDAVAEVDIVSDNADAALALGQQVAADIDLLTPRVIAIEDDSANVANAIIELEAEDLVLAGQISLVTADLDDLSAAVQNETYARVQGDEALASAIQQLQVSNAPAIFIQDDPPVPGVGGVPNPIIDGSIWYDSNDNNKQYRWLNNQWNDVTDANIGTLYALIADEQQARIDGDEAMALDITQLQVQRDNDYAIIVSNNNARISGDQALATSINGLTTNFNNLSATVASEAVTRSNADSALASRISVVEARSTNTETGLTNAVASITQVDQASISRDGALANTIDVVNSELGSTRTTVSQHTASINGIEGKYAVKIDNNGYVSGFGLISTANNATPTSTFTVLANNFKIVTPGTAAVTPFQVIGGITYIKDVRIDSAAIGVATIDTLNVKNGAFSRTFFNTMDWQGTNGPTGGNIWVAFESPVGYGRVNCTGQDGISNNIAPTGTIASIKIYLNGCGAGTASDDVQIRVARDDTTILPDAPQFRLLDNDRYASHVWEFFDTAPTNPWGHVYTLQIRNAVSGTKVLGKWRSMKMIVTYFKR